MPEAPNFPVIACGVKGLAYHDECVVFGPRILLIRGLDELDADVGHLESADVVCGGIRENDAVRHSINLVNNVRHRGIRKYFRQEHLVVVSLRAVE